MKTTFLIAILIIVVGTLILAGCAPGTTRFQQEKPAGFFWGIWHGWIAPVSLVWHLFNPAVRIYEKNNTGGWYDLGFYIAVVGGFGSIAISRKRKKVVKHYTTKWDS
jgi:hypothetical protein